jgi:hypothetical protein
MKASPLGDFIDSSGRLSKTASGNQYLIMAMDAYSKWPDAVAIPKLDSEATAKFFKREIIYRYGPGERDPRQRTSCSSMSCYRGTASRASPPQL